MDFAPTWISALQTPSFKRTKKNQITLSFICSQDAHFVLCWHILAQLNQLINLKLNKIMKKLVHKIRLTAFFFFLSLKLHRNCPKKSKSSSLWNRSHSSTHTSRFFMHFKWILHWKNDEDVGKKPALLPSSSPPYYTVP